MKRIIALSVACVLLITLASCGAAVLEKTDGGYKNAATGSIYRTASEHYGVTDRSEEVFARIERDGAEDILLYGVKGLPTSSYLVSDKGRVYHAMEALPALSDLPTASAIFYSVSQHGSSAVCVAEDEETVAALKNAYTNAVFFSYAEISPSLAGIAYDMTFVATEEYEGLTYTLKCLMYPKDVIIYVPAESRESYRSAYPGVPFVFEECTVEGETELFAVYNFGRALIYDVASRSCCAGGDAMERLLSE